MKIKKMILNYFSRRDLIPDRFIIPFEWEGKYDNKRVEIEYTKQYEKDLKLLGFLDKQKVKRFKKDIKNFYWDIDSPGNSSDDTHYLEDFSNPEKYHRFTKSINPEDRFDYLIYPPILDEENREVIIPVVIQSLKGHAIYGVGNYLETEEI